MFFALSEKNGTDEFSYLLVKKPGNVYEKEYVQGFYSKGNRVYNVFVKLNRVELIKTLKSLNEESYNSYQAEGVTPFSLNKAFDVLRSAMHNKYDEELKAILGEERINKKRQLQIEIGPFINFEDQVKNAFSFVGYSAMPCEQDKEENIVAHTYKVEGEDTLSVFLQKIFIVSLSLVSQYNLYKLSEEQVEKYINLSSSWFDLKNEYFKNILRSMFKNNKSIMSKFIEGVSEDEEAEEAKDTLYVNFSSLHKTRHNAVADIVKKSYIKENMNVVDLGCGEGKLSTKIHDILKNDIQNFNVFSYDIRDNYYKIASKTKRIMFHRMNILLPNPNLLPKSTDVLLFSEVIEHFNREDRSTLMFNISRIFKPKTIIFSTPNFDFNTRLGMTEGEKRREDHMIEFTATGLKDEVINRFVDFGYKVKSYISFAKNESGEWGYVEDSCLSQDSATFMIVFELDESLKDIKEKEFVHTAYDSFYLPISNTIITQKEIQSGYCSRAFTENHNNIFYIAPTVPPVDYFLDQEDEESKDYLEHPSSVFKYYRERGISELVCEEKYMGSRAHICIFKDMATANRFGCTTQIIINTRNGNRFFNSVEEDKFLQDIITKMDYDVLMLDTEMMPWSAKAKGLIRNKFLGVGEVNKINRLVQDDIKYDNALKYLESLRHYSSEEEEPYAVMFGILAYGRKANNRINWTMGTQINNLEKLAILEKLKGDKFRVVRSSYVSLEHSNSMEDEIFDWLKYCAGGGEGKVYKPINPINYSKDGYIIQPMMKVRGREYLRIIYGMDYLEPEIFDIVKNRSTLKKRIQAILETEMSDMLLRAFMHNKFDVRDKFVAGILGNENVNFSIVDKTL